MLNDTIAAISTALGEAAISVVRISGPQALPIAAQVLKLPAQVTPRQAYLVPAVDTDGGALDHGLLLYFKGPASYTGEDIVEFHGHGGVLVTQRVLERWLACGARAAHPGEFTQRAFLNGKMDLTQAEAVMDLIHAQSTLALRAANEQLSGGIGRAAAAMQQEIIPVLAHIEACIDFPDEDISPETGADLLRRIDAVLVQATQLIATSEQGRILRHGARTVISGAPNVGKSSLLNVLLGFERAIVSPTAGTTRDTIEEIIQVHGIPLRLVDTAGLREAGDDIERAYPSRRISHAAAFSFSTTAISAFTLLGPLRQVPSRFPVSPGKASKPCAMPFARSSPPLAPSRWIIPSPSMHGTRPPLSAAPGACLLPSRRSNAMKPPNSSPSKFATPSTPSAMSSARSMSSAFST